MGKINEIGNRYGRLLVIEEAGKNKQRHALWKCQCECGNIITVRGADLRNGHTKSCGCYQRDRTAEASVKDLVGQTIGNFTVLESIRGVKTGGSTHRWRCRCNLCGREDFIIATHEIHHQYSCGCTIISKGEYKITELLNSQNIKYETQKTFNSCKFIDSNNLARFDFYLPSYNCLIEFDGCQHFKKGTGYYDNEEKFKLTQEHDNYKNQWCKEHNIPIIRIPYTHYNNIVIQDLLPETSQFLI